jgi:DNA mismatch repair protein MutS
VAVARLAGLPQPVVDRARKLLDQFEKSGKRGDLMNALATRQLDLFDGGSDAAPIQTAPVETADPQLLALAQRLAGVEVDELSPRQALALIDELVAQAKALAPRPTR